MARKRTLDRLASKLDQLEKIKADIAKIEEREAARIGKIVMKSGLLETGISDEELGKELAAIAARFSTNKEPSNPSSDD